MRFGGRWGEVVGDRRGLWEVWEVVGGRQGLWEVGEVIGG